MRLCAPGLVLLLATQTLPARESGEPQQERQSLNSGLIEAARNADTASLLDLLSLGADVNAEDEDGTTALMAGASSGSLSVVRMLLDAGADPNRSDDYGRTAWSRAVERDYDEIVRTLVASGAVREGTFGIGPGVVSPTCRLLPGVGRIPLLLSPGASSMTIDFIVRKTGYLELVRVEPEPRIPGALESRALAVLDRWQCTPGSRDSEAVDVYGLSIVVERGILSCCRR